MLGAVMSGAVWFSKVGSGEVRNGMEWINMSKYTPDYDNLW